jgi:outer membrane immunogenic protein
VNRILTVALAATAFAATPALAQDATAPAVAAPASFTGPRIGVNVGIADDDIFGTEAFTYGAEAGYDFDLGNAVAGITAEIQDSKDLDREVALTARIGAKVGGNGLIYATGGYSNIKVFGIALDGFRVGLGGELALGTHGFVKVEQRYANYEFGVELFQTVVGAGVRF